jgi:site-specific recombinase XerD
MSKRMIVKGDILPMLESFSHALRARNRSQRTVQSYRETVSQFGAFLAERGMPTEVASITREHVETWIEHLLSRFRPTTAALRFRSLQQFFRWLLEEGEIPESPMRRMHPPSVPEEPPPVLSLDALQRLLKACSGSDLAARRDTAIVRTFIDTGCRLGEVTGMRVEDVDLEQGIVRVTGKGSRTRHVFIGARAVQAIDRYLRKRGRAPGPLWIGSRGPMTDSGITQILRRRAKQAGIGHLNPHQFRHTFAHGWLSSGGSEGDLRTIGGWKSRQMLDRYGASAASARAQEAHRRLSPGDRL